jgi:anti-sigma factor RsiW
MTNPATQPPGPRCAEIVELLGDHLEGVLPAARAAQVEAHLRDCEGCAALLEQLRATIALLGAASPDVVRDALPDDVRAALVERFRALTDPPTDAGAPA